MLTPPPPLLLPAADKCAQPVQNTTSAAQAAVRFCDPVPDLLCWEEHAVASFQLHILDKLLRGRHLARAFVAEPPALDLELAASIAAAVAQHQDRRELPRVLRPVVSLVAVQMPLGEVRAPYVFSAYCMSSYFSSTFPLLSE
jgi:hypothetical protein